MEMVFQVSEDAKKHSFWFFICPDILAWVVNAKERTSRFYLRSIQKALFGPEIVIAPGHSVLPNSISRNWDILVENIFRHFFTKTQRLFPICPHAVFCYSYAQANVYSHWADVKSICHRDINSMHEQVYVLRMSLVVNAWIYLNCLMGQIGPYNT